ncbi:hypothetical protein BS636_10635 [Acinetobacter sp. LoGeW2-3]|uniref:hypothetical protein n=1 Tax=Acinetobacter sp. LoGeW2-3 TaxID=1808001 RepID=UPI000C05A3E6|nr:hypothetical protein [Acinetobacter sp. LoGeW2-3]ATO20080.1 hypothetical protein BS636_10635 [Acinetobacter sp. LoGeW2-3]
MKKYIMALSVAGLAFWTNSHADMSLTQKALKPVIAYQCGQELKDSKVWKVSTFLMQDANKAKLEHNVCNCVGEKALKDIPATTLLKATVNEEAKNQLARQAVANSLKGCVQELMK